VKVEVMIVTMLELPVSMVTVATVLARAEESYSSLDGGIVVEFGGKGNGGTTIGVLNVVCGARDASSVEFKPVGYWLDSLLAIGMPVAWEETGIVPVRASDEGNVPLEGTPAVEFPGAGNGGDVLGELELTAEVMVVREKGSPLVLDVLAGLLTVPEAARAVLLADVEYGCGGEVLFVDK
jgi:hypothetical protein